MAGEFVQARMRASQSLFPPIPCILPVFCERRASRLRNTRVGPTAPGGCLTCARSLARRRQRRRVEYRVKLHQAQRPVSLTLFLISTFAFTLDTVTTLPYLLFRSALNYKTIPLYS